MAFATSTALRKPRQPGVATDGFTWTFVLLCVWMMAGAYLDSWHHHNLSSPETNFFTPYHFVLYSGIAAIGVFLGFNIVRNYRRYGNWDELLPDGYGVSLLGVVVFSIGGVLDLLWHLKFGIEVSVAALVSPTHLLLMLSGGLIVSGPLRAALRRGGADASWPAILSGALTLSMFTFFAQFDQPYIDRWAANTDNLRGPVWMEEELGILGMLLYAAMYTGLLLLMLRRFKLPLGAGTVILAVNAVLVTPVMNHTELVLAALIGGVASDIFLYVLRPSPSRSVAFHAFAFLAPAAFTASYLVVVAATTGVWWPTNIWTGAAPIAGTVGWLLSFVALPGDAARARIASTTAA